MYELHIETHLTRAGRHVAEVYQTDTGERICRGPERATPAAARLAASEVMLRKIAGLYLRLAAVAMTTPSVAAGVA